MSRSQWKPNFLHPEIISQHKKNDTRDCILFNRNTRLVQEMIGETFYVYNGIRFFAVPVNLEKVGHRLGEFSPSKKKPIPKKKKKIDGTKNTSAWITYRA